ncbi:MAG: GNAT family N-acetyltransferase [Methylophilaceae bacterium]|nr:GNAT family N-acetyltransferase [Methylophilaceae bacterium]
MIDENSLAAMIAHLKDVASQSPSGAVDEALRLGVWTSGSDWHRLQVLVAAAQLATEVNEYRLAGLAAYQAQRMYLAANGPLDQWGLPVLPGLEVAARRFNLVRYIPLVSRNVQLRRPRVSDHTFLLQMFRDPDFRQRYSRPVFGMEERRVHRIIERDGRAPLDDSAWVWIIADLNDQPLGLVELTELDFRLGNVDLAMGLRDNNFSTVAFEAFCLGLSVAFHHLGMKRVTGHVYDDNALSSRLHAHMGSVREFSMDGLVTDSESGRALPMTVYSMTPDEARASPWLVRLNRFLPASTPDLLRDSIDQIAGDILALGPRWCSTPPRVPPRVPEPPAATSNMSATPMPLPPEHLAGRRVALRPIGPTDRDTFELWLNTPGFIKASPAGIDAETGIEGLGESLGSEPGNILLWLVQEKGSQRQLGCIGVKIENRLPVLIGLAGFDQNASRYHIIESWRLLRSALFRSYPEARLYLKLPPYSDWQPWLESYRTFQNCGFERNQSCIGCAAGADLIVLGYEVRARRD